MGEQVFELLGKWKMKAVSHEYVVRTSGVVEASGKAKRTMVCVATRDQHDREDRCHERRGRFPVPLSQPNCTSVYSSERDKPSTETSTTSAITTFVTFWFGVTQSNRQNEVRHENLLAIKRMREWLKSTKQLTLFSLYQLVKNNALLVADLVISHNIDILALRETWLRTCVSSV